LYYSEEPDLISLIFKKYRTSMQDFEAIRGREISMKVEKSGQQRTF